MAKKQRSDSITTQGAAMRAAKVQPPKHIEIWPEALPFWDSVIKECARVDWTDHQLEMAAILARCMCQLVQEQEQARIEGTVITTDKGTPIQNPRIRAVHDLQAQVAKLRQGLAINGRAVKGEARDARKRTDQLKQAEAVVDELGGDGLLAGVN